MNKEDKRAFLRLTAYITAIMGCCLAIILFCGCNRMEVRQEFDFAITHLPVPSQVGAGEKVEIRFEIKHIEGRYDSNRYFVRYFPTAGAGTLTLFDSVLVPNDAYPIGEDKFRMYYTTSREAGKSEEHTLDLVFFDLFEHEKEVKLTFNAPADTTGLGGITTEK